MTVKVATDLSAIYRERFSVFNSLHYMNSCSQGALADTVKESFTEYLNTMEVHGSAWGDWAGYLEKTRSAIAEFFQVPGKEMAVTTSVSAAISAVASSLDFTGKRNKIVLTENEFPTAGQIWHAQSLRGAQVVHAPKNPDLTVDMSALINLIDEETAIVCVAHVNFRNGVLTELEPVIAAAHKAGALVMIDAYQSTGNVAIDLETLQPDFLVGGVLKYLLGTPGVGFLYAREETTKHLIPTSTGWFAAKDIFAMGIHSYEPAIDARRFESGTPPIPSLYPAVAGLKIINEIGIGAIVDYVRPLHEEMREGIEALGGIAVTPKDPHKHGALLAIASIDENAHVAALEEHKVITSCRDGNVRISPHFYNNREDVKAVIDAFSKTRHYLRK